MELNIDRIKQRNLSVDESIVAILLVLLFLVPYLPVFERFFISLEDLLMPVILLRWLSLRPNWKQSLIGLTALVAGYIAFTIFWNGRHHNISNFFEIYKLMKYSLVVLYTKEVLHPDSLYRYRHFMTFLALYLLVFNVLHYFDLFGFNDWMASYYDTDGRDIAFFGLNSLGQPGTKRLLGTMGNPNMNAIVLLLLLAYFAMIYKQMNIWLKTVAVMLVVALLYCQSRTSLVVFPVFLIAAWIWKRIDWRALLICFGLIAVFIAYNSYLIPRSQSYVANTSMTLSQNSSVVGRTTKWNMIQEEIKHKPWLGHSPYKAYYYGKIKYVDSEYLLLVWRYGAIGAVLFLLFFTVPFYRIPFSDLHLYGFCLIIVGVASITSNPFSDQKIMLLMAIGAGVALGKLKTIKTHETNSE